MKILNWNGKNYFRIGNFRSKLLKIRKHYFLLLFTSNLQIPSFFKPKLKIPNIITYTHLVKKKKRKLTELTPEVTYEPGYCSVAAIAPPLHQVTPLHRPEKPHQWQINPRTCPQNRRVPRVPIALEHSPQLLRQMPSLLRSPPRVRRNPVKRERRFVERPHQQLFSTGPRPLLVFSSPVLQTDAPTSQRSQFPYFCRHFFCCCGFGGRSNGPSSALFCGEIGRIL